MTLYKWSQTAANNATADSSINWQEGQAPSSVNDSARAMMASVAKWRDDVNGTGVTGGSGTAYTLTSNQAFASNGNGNTVQFTPGLTNTSAVTLSVDGNTARPLRFYPGVDLPAGVLISGSLYQATFRSASNEWLLHAFDSSIYAIPIGGSIVYWGANAPNGAFALPLGQQISRTQYASLYGLIGNTYGAGNGSTTFNLPDLVGRVPAMQDAGSARLSSSYFGGNPASLGAFGGGESNTLVANQIPTLTSFGSNNITVTPNGFFSLRASVSTITDFPSTAGTGLRAPGNSASMDNAAQFVGTNSIAVTTSGTGGSSGAAFRTVQPTIICNYIMRVI